MLAVLEARIATNGGTAIERRPFADAEAAGLVELFDPYPGYEQFLRRSLDLDALRGRRHRTCSSSRCGAPARAGSRACSAAGRIQITEIHQERNPYFGGVNPEPIRAEHRRGAGHPRAAAATTSACCSTATPTGRARPTSAARSSTSSRSSGLLMYYLLEHRGLRAAGREERQHDVDGRAARRALRRRRSTRRRSASSTSGRR